MEERGRTLVTLLTTQYLVTEPHDEVIEALRDIGPDDPPFVTFTSVTGYYPPLIVSVNATHVIAVTEQTEKQWEVQVAASRKHYAEQDRVAEGGKAGFG